MNKDLFLQTLRNYVKWQRSNGTFHSEFEKDLKRLQWANQRQYVCAAGGILFAGTVWNPNFVKRRSWYMRKIAIFGWSIVGYNLGRRYYEDHVTKTMLRMNDYFPLEVKRALQDKDFRHMFLINMDEESKTRQFFDPATGKSLS